MKTNKQNDSKKTVDNPTFTVGEKIHEITAINIFDKDDYIFGSICIDNMVWISIRIIMTKNGDYMLCLPSHKTKQGDYKSDCFFANKAIREQVLSIIIDKAEREGML